MNLTFDLWNIILQKLSLLELYNISLTCKIFNSLTKTLINEKFLVYRDNYISKCIYSWREAVLQDTLNYDLYNEYLGFSRSMKDNMLSNIITEGENKNIKYMVSILCNKHLNKKWMCNIHPKLFVFMLREWNSDNDYLLKKLILDHRVNFKERLRNIDKYNMFFLNTSSNYLLKDLDKDKLEILNKLP